jgi:double-stranded uracil-DNA glycosylase
MLIQDVLAQGLRVVFCGTALGTQSARAGAYYAGRGNRFWPTLHEVGLTPVVLRPDEYRRLLDYGIGLTDICKTRSGSDEEVGRENFDVRRLITELERYSPAWIAFNGKNAARAALGRGVEYGEQREALGGVSCFVLPSTSGAARAYWDVRVWRELAHRVQRAP